MAEKNEQLLIYAALGVAAIIILPKLLAPKTPVPTATTLLPAGTVVQPAASTPLASLTSSLNALVKSITSPAATVPVTAAVPVNTDQADDSASQYINTSLSLTPVPATNINYLNTSLGPVVPVGNSVADQYLDTSLATSNTVVDSDPYDILDYGSNEYES